MYNIARLYGRTIQLQLTFNFLGRENFLEAYFFLEFEKTDVCFKADNNHIS